MTSTTRLLSASLILPTIKPLYTIVLTVFLLRTLLK